MIRKYIIFLVLASLSLSTFAQINNDSKNNLFSIFFSEALKNRLQGNYQKSVEMYINCLKVDETSAAVPYELAKILRASNDYENANKFIDMALKNDDSSNKFYIELAVDIKLALQKYDELLPLIDKLIKYNNNDIQTYILASKIAAEIKQYDTALKYLNSIPNAELYEDYILPSKYDILMKSGKTKKAYKLINSKYEKNRKNAKYNFYMSDYSFRTNKNQDGIGYLKMATDCVDGDIYNFDMASIMLKINKLESFKYYTMRGFTSTNIGVETKINKLISSLSNEDRHINLDDAQIRTFYESVFDTLIYQYPDEENIYSIYVKFCTAELGVKYLDENSIYNKIVNLYQRLYDVGTLSVESWRDFLLNLSRLGRNDDVMKYSTEALLKYPDEPLLLLLQGECYVMNKDYSKSLQPLKHGYSILSSLNNSNLNYLKVAMMSTLATAYYYTDSASSAFAYFDEILKIDQYNVGALNNYSYYLSLEGKNLDYAEQMARKANDIQPGNPTFLDTYAWVLYKKKNYSEALFIIERAIDKIKSDSDNSEIYDHYGDILYMNNNTDKAVEYWQKSYILDKSDKTKKKIDARKIVE